MGGGILAAAIRYCRLSHARSRLDAADSSAGRAVGPIIRDGPLGARRAVCFFYLVGALAKPAGLRRAVSRLAMGGGRFDARRRRFGGRLALGLERYHLLAVVCPVSPTGRALLDAAGLDPRRHFVAEAPRGHAGLHDKLAAVVVVGGGMSGGFDFSAGNRPHGLGRLGPAILRGLPANARLHRAVRQLSRPCPICDPHLRRAARVSAFPLGTWRPGLEVPHRQTAPTQTKTAVCIETANRSSLGPR